MSQKELKECLGLLKNELQYFESDFKLWKTGSPLPKFAILIPRKSRILEYFFVEQVLLKGTIYFASTEESENNHQLKVKIIYSMRNDEIQKEVKEFQDEYFVYEWQEKRNFNKTLTAKEHLLKMKNEE